MSGGRDAPRSARQSAAREDGVPAEATRVGRRGTVVIPARLRHRYGLEEGSLVVAEAVEDGVLLRPAVVLPVEVYTPERKAGFLLSNAVDPADYAAAVRTVEGMGLDPASIPHRKPRRAR